MTNVDINVVIYIKNIRIKVQTLENVETKRMWRCPLSSQSGSPKLICVQLLWQYLYLSNPSYKSIHGTNQN